MAALASTCAWCDAPAAHGCGRCRLAYCSRRCQEHDWPAHQVLCAEMDTLSAESSRANDVAVGDEARIFEPLGARMVAAAASTSKSGVPENWRLAATRLLWRLGAVSECALDDETKEQRLVAAFSRYYYKPGALEAVKGRVERALAALVRLETVRRPRPLPLRALDRDVDAEVRRQMQVRRSARLALRANARCCRRGRTRACRPRASRLRRCSPPTSPR